MPYKLRKAPKRELYWVVNKETGSKHSKDPLPKEKALAQMRALYAAEGRKEGGIIARAAVRGITKAATKTGTKAATRGLTKAAERKAVSAATQKAAQQVVSKEATQAATQAATKTGIPTRLFQSAKAFAARNPVTAFLAKTAASVGSLGGISAGLQEYANVETRKQTQELSDYYDQTISQQDQQLQEQLDLIEQERAAVEDAKKKLQEDYDRQVKTDQEQIELANKSYQQMIEEQNKAINDYLASLRAELLTATKPTRTFTDSSSPMPKTTYTPTAPSSTPSVPAPTSQPAVDLESMSARDRARYLALYGSGKSTKLKRHEKKFLVDALCDMMGESPKVIKVFLKENGM